MVSKVRTQDALTLVAGELRHEAYQLADQNPWISKKERQRSQDTILNDAWDAARTNTPSNKWISADATTQQAVSRVQQELGAINQPAGSGRPFLSLLEVQRLKDRAPLLGAIVGRAYETIKQTPKDQPIFTEFYRVPKTWKPEAVIQSGVLQADENGRAVLSGVQVRPEHRAFVDHALQYLWDQHLQYAANDEPLNVQNQGQLRIGTFEDPATHKTHFVADWKDIDDGSYTLYYRPGSEQNPKLEIIQFSN